MNDFIKRNMPVLIIGLSTVLIFLVIILLSQTRPGTTAGSKLVEVSSEALIASYSPIVGKVDAPITLVEFADYECPACKAFSNSVKRVYETNRDVLRIVYRQFPLPQHTYARKAAEAAMIAKDMGKFEEYANKLYENSPQLSVADLVQYADELGLDRTSFEAKLKNAEYTKYINEDMASGNKIGINATPTFFLNGKKMELSSFEDFEKQVNQFANDYRASQAK